MPRVPAHLHERALGMLQGGMRTADVARAINCNVRTVRRLRQRYRETGRTGDCPRSGRPCVTTAAQDHYIQTSHLQDRYRMATTITSPATTLPMGTNPLSLDQTGLAKVLITDDGFVSPGVMVRFAFIVEGMSITPRPVLWSGIDLEVEGPPWSGAVSHSIIGLSLLSLQAISMLCVTGKISFSLMWYPSCRLILT
uniref:Paired domain-containing protein n=1 Tax=Salmo trutta TaxID=8032 RepID=A0A674BV00_SALTR